MKRFLTYILFTAMSLNILSVQAFAANSHGSGIGCMGSLTPNDYHVDNWNRFEYNYEFDSGPVTTETFGVPTTTDVIPRNKDLENVRRNKDAALIPPSYGVFSGNIPTAPSSLYHDNTTPDYAVVSTFNAALSDTYYSAIPQTPTAVGETSMLASTSLMAENTNGATMATSQVYTNSNYLLTESMQYSDGSIGLLEIPRLNIAVKVFEGETLENMKKGAGHFEFTSNWDGNIGIASHNRGSSGYFEGVKNIKIGDEIAYTTKYGVRYYEVVAKEKISDTDYSWLGWTNDNRITLITCVGATC